MGWGASYEVYLMGHLMTREGCTGLRLYKDQLAYVIPNKLSKKEPQSLSSSDDLEPFGALL